jgi:hypothetical protein
MVEIFFGIITRQAIRRGSFTSVTDLEAAIRDFIDAYNHGAKPFTRTRTADELLDKVTRKPNSQTRDTNRWFFHSCVISRLCSPDVCRAVSLAKLSSMEDTTSAESSPAGVSTCQFATSVRSFFAAAWTMTPVPRGSISMGSGILRPPTSVRRAPTRRASMRRAASPLPRIVTLPWHAGEDPVSSHQSVGSWHPVRAIRTIHEIDGTQPGPHRMPDRTE